MKLEADFFGEDLVAAKILGVGDRASDLRPAFKEWAVVLRRAAERQFDTEGTYGSGGWAPLAPSTARRKRALGLDNKILQRTYRLRQSVTGEAPDAVVDYDRQSFEYGTRVPYAGYHQSGTATMPRRRVLETTKSDRKGLTRAIYEQLMREGQ